ncbi:hypothetical protein [Rubripirellula lacrimiformis]|uniref:hypothetical protein n=1 Tax=Rubripirellula lacrimiformis TaxID=1930273 RepID=UPI00119EFE7B|nr:hypothetical protein [Rubripirellula lacrimiformis]
MIDHVANADRRDLNGVDGRPKPPSHLVGLTEVCTNFGQSGFDTVFRKRSLSVRALRTDPSDDIDPTSSSGGKDMKAITNPNQSKGA